MSSDRSMSRIPELDAVRGLAACAIVAYHLWFLGPRSAVGHYVFLSFSVDLFFVLSGYLITSIIIKSYKTQGFLTRFYVRRSLRIWPIYYLTLLTYLLINPFLPHPGPTSALPFYLTYTQNIQLYWNAAPPPIADVFGHFWTLALEEQFYLIWPALILLAGPRRVLAFSLFFILSAAYARSVGYNNRILLARSDGFAMGGALAVLFSNGQRIRQHLVSYRLGFCLLFVIALAYPLWGRILVFDVSAGWSPWAYALNLTFINLAFFSLLGLILCCANHPLLKPLRDARLCYIGTISYGLYVYHPIVFQSVDYLADRLGIGRSVWLSLLELALAFGVAAISWRYLEQPILRLKERFDYGEKPTAPPRSQPAEASAVPEPAVSNESSA